MTPRVSIVVPTHRRPELLRALLDSLHAQTHPHAELELVVVPTPGDPGLEVVEAFRARTDLPVTCSAVPDDPWQGRSASAKRNHGATLARGEWLAFVDDDCVADPGWIAAAAPLFAGEGVAGVEGQTVIPAPERPTLTWKGLRQLARTGGYQTCNMFYRRDRFLEVGGFDPSFPFYLEDTDLAWTVLDRGWRIAHAEHARVTHPTPPPAPWRLLDDARRVLLMPYLYRKHPGRYRAERKRALRASHWLYLLLYGALVGTAVAGQALAAAALGAALLLLVVAQSLRLFAGCRVEPREVLVTTALLPVIPLVRGVQLVRGNLRQGVWLWT